MNDSGSIVLGWLTKVVIVLSVLGMLAFDGIALVSARFTAADHANAVAIAAADNYRTSRNPVEACQVGQTEAATHGETLDCNDPEAFRIEPDGHVVLVIHRTATTLWMHRFGFLKKYTDQTGTGTGVPAL